MENKPPGVNLTPEQQKEMFKDTNHDGVPDLVEKQLEQVPGFMRGVLKTLVKMAPTNPNMRIRDEQGNIIQMPEQPRDPVAEEERKEKRRRTFIIMGIIDLAIVGFILYFVVLRK